jgi:hypothetical protein
MKLNVSIALKIAPALIGIIIVIWHFTCLASASSPNANIVNYKFGRYDYNFFLIIPDNLTEYKYLSHNPFTSFMFLNYYNEEKIAKLTVKELKSRSLGGPDSGFIGNGFYEVLKFDKLKGFEDIAEDLINFNEFDIAERKDEILSKLVELYGKYKADFKGYLEGFDGTYQFRKGNLKHSTLNKLKEYNEKVKSREPNPRSFYQRTDINDYNFDEKFFKIDLLNPKSKRSSQGWEYHYLKKFKRKYGSLEYQNNPILYNIDFPEEIRLPMSLEDAKKIFPIEDNVFCETILTVTPEKGAFGYQGASFFVMTSNFNIKKITKKYYNQKNWSDEEQKFIGDPVLTIELKSKENQPLY